MLGHAVLKFNYSYNPECSKTHPLHCGILQFFGGPRCTPPSRGRDGLRDLLVRGPNILIRLWTFSSRNTHLAKLRMTSPSSPNALQLYQSKFTPSSEFYICRWHNCIWCTQPPSNHNMCDIPLSCCFIMPTYLTHILLTSCGRHAWNQDHRSIFVSFHFLLHLSTLRFSDDNPSSPVTKMMTDDTCKTFLSGFLAN